MDFIIARKSFLGVVFAVGLVEEDPNTIVDFGWAVDLAKADVFRGEEAVYNAIKSVPYDLLPKDEYFVIETEHLTTYPLIITEDKVFIYKPEDSEEMR